MTLRPVYNPPNPWESVHGGEFLEGIPRAELKVFEEQAKSFISTNDSPDLGFRHSANPYRGCTHACAYCYARPSHQYLGHGAGTDFETKIVAKLNAAELLRQEFLRPKWTGEVLVLSGNTDCYQPLEASYKLTRGCLEVCASFRNPLSIITKSPLIVRDTDLLQQLTRDARVHVNLSCAFSDDAMAAKMEPGAPPPSRRFAAMEKLARAGVSVGVGLAPIIPGLNDGQIPEILQRSRDAGARFAFRTMLRLPAEVKDVFFHTLEEQFPTHAKKVRNLVMDARDGQLNNAQFGKRFSGSGPLWRATDELFELSCRRLGLNSLDEEAGMFDDFKNAPATFVRPGQMELL